MNTLFTSSVAFDIFIVIKQTLTAILAWLFGFPLSLIIRRDPCLTVFISRPGKFFSDNGKYSYIYAVQYFTKEERIVFLTSDHSIRNQINEAGGESVQYPSLHSIYLILRCKNIILDWRMQPGIYPLTFGAGLIQLWHGSPLKHIELDLYRKRLAGMPNILRPILRLQKNIIGRYPVYDLVIATSHKFIDVAFKTCFEAGDFLATGYPRNDILLGWPDRDKIGCRLTKINVDTKVFDAVSAARSHGTRICLYVPTFRKDMENPFDSRIDLLRMSELAQKNNLYIILKLHPVMYRQYPMGQYPRLLEYDPLGDVYPLMPLCDLLITDYSSIYFDYLLLNRPIIFFAYDLDRYLSRDRALYFDYNDITPGVKCSDYDQLESAIDSIINNDFDDGCSDRRRQVLSFTHDYKDNRSGQRLFTYLTSHPLGNRT